MNAIIITMITMVCLAVPEDSRATESYDIDQSKAHECLEIKDAIKDLWYLKTDQTDFSLASICLDGFLKGDKDEAGHILCTQFIKECGL